MSYNLLLIIFRYEGTNRRELAETIWYKDNRQNVIGPTK